MAKRLSASRPTADQTKPAAPTSAFADALRKKELVARVADSAGIKKGDARPIIDAVLAELGETLADGRPMILPPLGRMKVTRKVVQDKGQVMILRLRQPRLSATADLSGAVPPSKG